MFIAHIPAGYLFSTLLVSKMKSLSLSTKFVIFAGVLGSLVPDLDMFYFYLVDNRQTHHHKYITHWPLLWALSILLSITWFWFRRSSNKALFLLIFSVSAFLHCLLDSLVGDVWWFAPFVDEPYSLFTVPAVVTPWWLNFVLHWSFAVEILLCIWAVVIYVSRTQKKRKDRPT